MRCESRPSGSSHTWCVRCGKRLGPSIPAIGVFTTQNRPFLYNAKSIAGQAPQFTVTGFIMGNAAAREGWMAQRTAPTDLSQLGWGGKGGGAYCYRLASLLGASQARAAAWSRCSYST